MTERQKEAIKYIEGQLEDGYLDLGLHDQDELDIVKEAIDMWKTIDKWNSLGCTSFNKLSFTDEEVERIFKKINTQNDIICCAIKQKLNRQ